MSAYIKFHMKLCWLLLIGFFASVYFVYIGSINVGIPFVIAIIYLFSVTHYFVIQCFSCAKEYADIFSVPSLHVTFWPDFFSDEFKAVNNCYECDAKIKYKFNLFPYMVIFIINIIVAIVGYIIIDIYNINTLKIYRLFDGDFNLFFLSIFLPVPLEVANFYLLRQSIVTIRPT